MGWKHFCVFEVSNALPVVDRNVWCYGNVGTSSIRSYYLLHVLSKSFAVTAQQAFLFHACLHSCLDTGPQQFQQPAHPLAPG